MQRVLAELIRREVKDPRVGSVTVTQVQLAADLGQARVFFVPLGGTADPSVVQAGLTAAAGFLRGEVGRAVGLRHAPKLVFVADELFDKASELTALIDAANKPRS